MRAMGRLYARDGAACCEQWGGSMREMGRSCEWTLRAGSHSFHALWLLINL